MKKFFYTKDGKKVSLWEEVANDPNYGLKWKQRLEKGVDCSFHFYTIICYRMQKYKFMSE